MASTETLENLWVPSSAPRSNGHAERRAHLIRTMAGSKRSCSSQASQSENGDDVLGRGSGWDTNSHQIPAARPEPDFQINTSALKRAFPDFSAHGSSTEDSIELGRALPRSNKSSHNLPSEDVSEALQFSLGQGQNFRLMATPPIKPKKSMDLKKDARRQSMEKENADPKKETRYGSGSSGKGSTDSRRTLVEKHTTVESDDSVILQEARPSQLNSQNRNIRFTAPQVTPKPASRRQPSEQVTHNDTHTSAMSGAAGTYQSFAIPDMPNITELITGHRQDGTPIFNRSAKSRSRFTTPASRRTASGKPSHVPVENAPVPADAKALYVSLQMLQEKVSELESSKQQSEQKAEENELEILQLKSKLEELEHKRDGNDSGLGSDAEDGKVKEMRDEKSKLETSLRTLQERLDRANRKVTKSEAQVSDLTKDRDALHAQLGMAYLDAKQDDADESTALTTELQKLRKELRRVTKDHQKRIDQLTKQETELRGKIERREKAVTQMASLAKELYDTRVAMLPRPQTQAQERDPSIHVEKLRQPVERQHHELSNATSLPRRRSGISSEGSAQQRSGAERRRGMRTDHIDAYDSEEDAGRTDADTTTNIQLSRPQQQQLDLTKDNDFLSFMDGDEVEKLRTVVDADKERLAQLGGHVMQQQDCSKPNRKSSMKKVSYGDFTEHSLPASEHTNTTRNVTERQETQQSVRSQASERRRRSGTSRGDQTSAFLVPDVTLRSAQQDAASEVQSTVKLHATIPRPIPVSDRMPEDPDTTTRPAQDPALALATVIKNLQDELAQLRAQLQDQETLYHQHDPSLSKRKRKIVFTRMQKLLAAIEMRSDQIYALYDVLEGQKASGQMMKEEEVEVTLQNLGLDGHAVATANEPSKTVIEDDVSEQSGDERDGEESDLDDDFPSWNGLEATQTQTLDGLPRMSRP